MKQNLLYSILNGIFIPLQTKFSWGTLYMSNALSVRLSIWLLLNGHVYEQRLVCPPVHMTPAKWMSRYWWDYSVAVYRLMMWIIEDIPGSNYFKGDNLEVWNGGILLWFDSVLVYIVGAVREYRKHPNQRESQIPTKLLPRLQMVAERVSTYPVECK